MKPYWIAYNPVDDCVEYSEGKPSWDYGNRCWRGSGEEGILSHRSCYDTYRDFSPMQVWLSENDKAKY